MICPPKPSSAAGRAAIAARRRNGSPFASRARTAKSTSIARAGALSIRSSKPGAGRRSTHWRASSFPSSARSMRPSSPRSKIWPGQPDLSAGRDGGARLGQGLFHLAANAVVGHFDAALRQRRPQGGEKRLVGNPDIAGDKRAGVGLGFGAVAAQHLRKPKAEQFVAPRQRLEGKLLIDRETFFEAFFALVECGHAALPGFMLMAV